MFRRFFTHPTRVTMIATRDTVAFPRLGMDPVKVANGTRVLAGQIGGHHGVAYVSTSLESAPRRFLGWIRLEDLQTV